MMRPDCSTPLNGGHVEMIARGYKVTFVERLLRLPLTAGCYGLKGWSKVCEFPNLLTDQFEI